MQNDGDSQATDEHGPPRTLGGRDPARETPVHKPITKSAKNPKLNKYRQKYFCREFRSSRFFTFKVWNKKPVENAL